MFHKYGENNIAITNCMLYFSMFIPTKAHLKLSYGNKVNTHLIGIILCHFPILPIIHPVVLVCYCPGSRSNTISLGALKVYTCLQNFASEPLEHFDFVDPQGSSWISP